jgi:hypothetical protein
MLVISAIGVGAALLRANGSDSTAVRNLQAMLRAAEAIRMNDASPANGGFGSVTAPALEAKVQGVTIASARVASGDDRVVSMDISDDGDGVYGWYGAVRSKSGRCFAAATINGDPQEHTAVLPGNCTGDAARATLSPVTVGPPSMVSTPPAPAGAAAGATTHTSG